MYRRSRFTSRMSTQGRAGGDARLFRRPFMQSSPGWGRRATSPLSLTFWREAAVLEWLRGRDWVSVRDRQGSGLRGTCACSLRSLSLLPEGERHPISLFAGYRIEWRVLEVYRTSPGVRRSFCGDYEMPLLYENERLPGEESMSYSDARKR